jgi:Secretion system C-terminal sorting domain
MNKKIHLLILFLSPILIYSQNLIINGGFENYTQLPSTYGQYYLCNGWSNCGGGGSPDFFHINGTGQAKLPNPFPSTINPHSGNAVMGLSLYAASATNFREYLSTTLSSALVVGQNYQLSFYFSNGTTPIYYGGLGSNNFSISLSTSALSQTVSYNPITTITPQYIYNGFLFSNSWQLVTYEFVADAAYQYITFGSFVNDSTQQLQQLSPAANLNAYYYIDDVSLSQSLSVEEQTLESNIKIYRDKSTESLNIDTTNNDLLDISLLDLNGRLLTEKTFTNKTSIDTQLLAKGIYLYQIKSKNTILKQGKIAF